MEYIQPDHFSDVHGPQKMLLSGFQFPKAQMINHTTHRHGTDVVPRVGTSAGRVKTHLLYMLQGGCGIRREGGEERPTSGLSYLEFIGLSYTCVEEF